LNGSQPKSPAQQVIQVGIIQVGSIPERISPSRYTQADIERSLVAAQTKTRSYLDETVDRIGL
jgi:hypothetical protein